MQGTAFPRRTACFATNSWPAAHVQVQLTAAPVYSVNGRTPVLSHHLLMLFLLLFPTFEW